MSNWFYIRSTNTGKVVSAIANTEYLRSQVIVTSPQLNDFELWCWNGQFLMNKATELVLDIRKGRLRLIEDTEICLYTPKPLEEANNQLWNVRGDLQDDFGRPLPGSFIHSVCNDDWVLDVQTCEGGEKLVLFPLQPIDIGHQRWLFVPEGQLDLSIPIQDSLRSTEPLLTPPASLTSSPNLNDLDFPRGLTPAKRGSHSSGSFSLDSCKDYHQRVYSAHDTNLTDKGIAMACAFHIYQNWKSEQSNNTLDFTSIQETKSKLQELTQTEVNCIFNLDLYNQSNNKDSALAISNRIILQLYDQTPISP